jgi:hypothetical protein
MSAVDHRRTRSAVIGLVSAPRFDGIPGRAYHPPDDDAPRAFWRQARLRAFRG